MGIQALCQGGFRGRLGIALITLLYLEATGRQGRSCPDAIWALLLCWGWGAEAASLGLEKGRPPVSSTLCTMQHGAGKLNIAQHVLLHPKTHVRECTPVSSHGALLVEMRQAEPPGCPAA